MRQRWLVLENILGSRDMNERSQQVVPPLANAAITLVLVNQRYEMSLLL